MADGTENRMSNIPEDIRLILGIANSDPDLQAAFQALTQGRYDDMYAAIYRSSFYRNNNATARNRQAAKQRQPGAYNTEYNNWKLETYKRLRKTGVQITPAIDKELEQAYLFGMSEDQVDAIISQKGLLGTIGGETGGTVATLQAYAGQMGVSNYYQGNYWEQKKKQLFDGTTTPEDIKQEIKTFSAGLYPAYSERIMAGKTLESEAAPIVTIVSNRVGRQLSTSSPEVVQFLQWKNPQTGKFEQPPGWYVDMKSWELPGADTTPEAIQKADSVSVRVLQDWGLM